MGEIRHIAELGPELDFLALAQAGGETGNIRDRVSRWMKSGLVIGVVPGIYVTASEFRKRPISFGILANMIYGPSYVSFEYILSRAGIIPEAVSTVMSATPKRNRDFDTALGRFSYRHIPHAAYSFGILREELADGSGFLVARPEKALLDCLYRAGALRSMRSLEARLFEDLRIDPDAFRSLDAVLLAEYAAKMPGAAFRVHFAKLIGRNHA
jgi:predicted transcriptional regulator of viral defense system